MLHVVDPNDTRRELALWGAYGVFAALGYYRSRGAVAHLPGLHHWGWTVAAMGLGLLLALTGRAAWKRWAPRASPGPTNAYVWWEPQLERVAVGFLVYYQATLQAVGLAFVASLVWHLGGGRPSRYAPPQEAFRCRWTDGVGLGMLLLLLLSQIVLGHDYSPQLAQLAGAAFAIMAIAQGGRMRHWHLGDLAGADDHVACNSGAEDVP